MSDFNSSIKLAATFTSLVLGTLQDVIEIFAERGDVPLTVGVASVVGQEGEQEGWYRLLQGKVPSELPFLTTSTREFAFNALNQNFIVPGSCPNINLPLSELKNTEWLYFIEFRKKRDTVSLDKRSFTASYRYLSQDAIKVSQDARTRSYRLSFLTSTGGCSLACRARRGAFR